MDGKDVERVGPGVAPQMAEMVGTTRSRITYFMNKFRKKGLIDYDGELTVRPDRLTHAVLERLSQNQSCSILHRRDRFL